MNHHAASSQNAPPRHALIVGCGDIGRRLARLLRDRNIAVTGTVRRAEAADALRADGITPFRHDLDRPPPRTVPFADWLFWCAPPPTEGQTDTDPRPARWLAAAPLPARVVYVSTTGVYAPPDHPGDTLTEDHPLAPTTLRGRRRLHAERTLLAFAPHAVIARVPGIYAPDRLPEARLRQGLPVPLRAECPPTNRIHADDLASALLACAAHGHPGRAYNVTDGAPSPMTDYFLAAARVLDLPPPPQVPLRDFLATAGPAMASFFGPARRLDSARARAELGWQPRYCSLLEGLAAINNA